MKGGTDWSAVWPMAAAASAFGLVYVVSLANGASVEEVLLRSTGALLVVGLVGFILSALLNAALTDDADDEDELSPPSGSHVDITLPEAAPSQAPDTR